MALTSSLMIDFALKLKYPFQYPNRSNPGIETQLATVDDWVEVVKFGYGPDQNIEFQWEYIDHEQFKNI